MSNLLFGIAGAAIGSAFGMPALGFALGSGVGAALGGHHHTAPPAWPGARLNDLKIQTSTYGIGIPRVYGIYRLAGNVIWATDILEVKDPAARYLYYGNFAIGLCAGPIAGIRRIWADGKEIFKDPFPSEGIRIRYPQGLRFYPGDEQQGPDPLLETHQGKGQVPAFRSLAYVVFEHFPLANFNNRLPSISVEVVQAIVERPLTPEEAAEKTRTEEETVVQDGVRYQIKRNRRRKPSSPEAKIQVPARLPLAEVVTDLCIQVGFEWAQVDVTLLQATVTGFVLSQPTSVREALALLQQAYAFDVVESGVQLKCRPRERIRPLPIAESERVLEEGAESAQSVMTHLPSLELPDQVVVFFTEADQDYRLATQTAQRAESICHAREQVELPLVLSVDEAAHIADKLLTDRGRTQISFSLSRAYAALEPSDRIVLSNRIWRVLSTEYGPPGLIKIKAVEETVAEMLF